MNGALRDRWLWGALLAGLLLRCLPMFLWPQTDCVRDECIYRFLAHGILDDGVMGVTTKGWLAAPGYPYLLAFTRWTTGSWFPLKWLQIAVSLTSIPVLYGIAHRVTPEKPVLAGRWAAWLLALHPTVAWYTNTWWIETFYIALLLPAILLALHGDKPWRGGVAGVLLGLAILFRGVATYLPPIFVLALVLEKQRKTALALVVGTVLTVAPYSLFASRQYGGFVVSDATMGHVLFLGNNDFPPMTFDYGNGTLTQPMYYGTLKRGRKPCKRNRPPVQHARCDVDRAVDWISEHPQTFVERIPLRLAQQLNPHSFLTRHVRWGLFWGVSGLAQELLVLWIALNTVVVVLGGTLSAVARARGVFAWIAGGTILYTMVTAAVSYGMSRFRLPLEPLWIVWLAALLASPKTTLAGLRGPRAVGLLLLPVLAWCMAWFATSGIPLLWR